MLTTIDITEATVKMLAFEAKVKLHYPGTEGRWHGNFKPQGLSFHLVGYGVPAVAHYRFEDVEAEITAGWWAEVSGVKYEGATALETLHWVAAQVKAARQADATAANDDADDLTDQG